MGLEEGGVGLQRWPRVVLEQSRVHREEGGDTRFLFLCLQDVDEVFLSKMELEGKLEALREYICFLRRLYEEVRVCQGQKWWSPRAGGSEGGDRGCRLPVAIVGGARR